MSAEPAASGHPCSHTGSNRRRWLVWGAVFLVALAGRGAFLWLRPPSTNQDELIYVQLAERLAGGEGFARGFEPETHISPLFPTLHALLIDLGGDSRRAALILVLLAASVVPVLVGLVFQKHLGTLLGLAAAVAVALHPYLVAFSRLIQPEPLTTLLLLWFLLLWRRGALELAAIVLGLAFLSRPETIFLLPVWILVESWRRPRRWLRIALAGGICLAVVSPFLLYLKEATGRFCLTGKDIWIYVNGIAQVETGNQPVPVALLQRLEQGVDGVVSHIAAHPAAFLRGYLIRCRYLAGHLITLITLPGVPLVIAGAVWIWIKHRSALLWIAFPLALLPILPIGMTHQRHLITILPLLIGLGGVGAMLLLRWAYRKGVKS